MDEQQAKERRFLVVPTADRNGTVKIEDISADLEGWQKDKLDLRDAANWILDTEFDGVDPSGAARMSPGDLLDSLHLMSWERKPVFWSKLSDTDERGGARLKVAVDVYLRRVNPKYYPPSKYPRGSVRVVRE
jgi:hypothetical protein